MECNMNLHKNTDDFRAAISDTARTLGLQEHIVEKDYWVTMLLKRMSTFEYKDFVIFKGGTSLSKGYKIIQRFSEDVDLALKPEAIAQEIIHRRSGEAIHRVLKKLRLDELNPLDEGKESEKQRYKRVYEFPKYFSYPTASPIHGRIILEVNSFSNPIPTEAVNILSLVGEYIKEKNGEAAQTSVGLESFDIHALVPERTFCEKLLAIRRASMKDDQFFSARVRHLYDIHQLYHCSRIMRFTNNVSEFETMLSLCHSDDKINEKISAEINNSFAEFDIFSNPEKALVPVVQAYNALRSITYDGKLPSIKSVSEVLKEIGNRLKGFVF